MHLAEVARIVRSCRDSDRAYNFESFRREPTVAALRWPADVLEQWLYDHADNEHFLQDYGAVDLSSIAWDVEVISRAELMDTPTGPSDTDCIERFAANPAHWISVRSHGIHKGVSETWETHGTWKRWPILIDRSLLSPPSDGLQVVEGRTRVGVLKGRHSNGSFVAPKHLAWVGRAASGA